MNFYNEIFLDHYRFPKNYGLKKTFSQKATEENPLCGDSLTVQIKIGRKKIQNIRFVSEGCVISKASASLLFDFLKNKSLQTALHFTPNKLFKLLPAAISPARISCATLGLSAFLKALKG